MVLECLRITPTLEPLRIDENGQINLKEATKLIPILFPYKGVFTINHDWGRENRGEAFGANEIRFAVELGFCLITFEDLLVFRQAIEDCHIDAWFFLEEIWLTDGVLDLQSFPGYDLDKKYRRK